MYAYCLYVIIQLKNKYERYTLKLNKLFLSMQLLSIVPALLFIFIYAHNSILYVSIGILLLLLISVNTVKYRNNSQLFKYSLPLLLLATFFIYAFYALGSKEAPQNYEVLHYKKIPTASFDFEKPTQIDKMCFNIGIDKSVKFSFEYLKNKKWESYYKHDKNFPFSFRWLCVDKNVTTSKMRLQVSKNQMMLNEVRFMHKDKTIFYKTDKQYLNDEQNLTIDTSYYGGMFFDEIYHSRTAYEIIHGIKVYETTHPYLGKLLIIPGIQFFGMTPFGWRVSNVVFAGLFILLMYYFALKLFRKRFLAFSSAFLLTYSFMHFTQSRIGLIDTFGVFFVFVSYYFLYGFIKEQKLALLLWSGLFFGLASSVKWSAVFAALGFVFIALYLLLTKYPLNKRFAGIKLILYGILAYVLLAGSVYLLSFFDIYLQTGSFQKIIDYQFSMYDYHSKLVSSHPYSSSWWSWPIDFKPMCYDRVILSNLQRSITVFGNPAIFWVGTVAIFYLIYVSFKKRTLEALFILLAFLGLYLPYIFVGRLMFIYHFYYAVPFMILGIVYMLRDAMIRFPKYRHYYHVYLGTVALLFLAYYPVLSGYEVPKAYVDYVLRWFPGWWL